MQAGCFVRLQDVVHGAGKLACGLFRERHRGGRAELVYVQSGLTDRRNNRRVMHNFRPNARLPGIRKHHGVRRGNHRVARNEEYDVLRLRLV